jgi:hypothetical protein
MKRLLIVLLMTACGPFSVQAAERSTAVAEVALTHAMLALEEGDAARAVRLLELAVRYDPENGTARRWLEVALRRAKAGPETGLETGPAVPLPLPEEDAGSTEPVIRPPRWEARLGVELGRDSNPALLPDELAGAPALTAGPSTATADEAANLGLHLTNNTFQDRRGWSLGWSATGLRSFHRDLGGLDLTFFEAAASLAWGADPRGYAEGPLGLVRVPARPGRLSLVLQAGGSSVRLGGDPYLRTAAGAGSLLIRGPGSGATRLDAEVRDRRYNGDGPPPLQRSGTEVSLAASRIYFGGIGGIGGNGCSLRFGASASRWSAGQAFDGSSLEGLAEITAPLPGQWSLFLQGSRREDRFAHAASNLADPFAAARRDATWRVLAAAVRPLSDRFRLIVRGMWIERGSNVDFPPGFPLYDYRRTMFAAGLAWTLS